MKGIHPEVNKCIFECASCGSKFEIDTTLKAGSHAIDVCSKCHPFYMGKVANKHLRGRSEKLSQKFETAKSNMSNATTKKSNQKVRKARENKGLESL